MLLKLLHVTAMEILKACRYKTCWQLRKEAVKRESILKTFGLQVPTPHLKPNKHNNWAVMQTTSLWFLPSAANTCPLHCTVKSSHSEWAEHCTGFQAICQTVLTHPSLETWSYLCARPDLLLSHFLYYCHLLTSRDGAYWRYYLCD